MASTRSKLDEIVESFSALEDPRFHINRRPPLPSILVISVLAVLAGAAGPTAIARWAVKFEVSPLCRRLQSFTGWEPHLLEPLRDLIVFSDEA
jgi:DDE_Tnp_1-associated